MQHPLLKELASSVAEVHPNFSLVVLHPNETIFSEGSISPIDCSDRLTLPVKGTSEEVNHSLKILLMLFVICKGSWCNPKSAESKQSDMGRAKLPPDEARRWEIKSPDEADRSLKWS
ncbi:hypothetical protein CEXT_233191 [Caerostris extrusa]|uniref:Uncharacterized protein n=1 Tax=Caerostris extrusa TaxID=172846 RepID=A0AAV4XWD8_CAEEX|nr:hypothetical protein CEXT_233191 [Caerostris extrusa]